jgi:hypothetical protein
VPRDAALRDFELANDPQCVKGGHGIDQRVTVPLSIRVPLFGGQQTYCEALQEPPRAPLLDVRRLSSKTRSR